MKFMFLYLVDYRRKVEELLWRKIYFDVVIVNEENIWIFFYIGKVFCGFICRVILNFMNIVFCFFRSIIS